MTSSVISCRWDWCRSTFASVDALDTHVKHEHIWPMKPMRRAEIALMRRMDLQSLHSSPDTGSSIISRGISFPSTRSEPQTSMTPGLIAGVSSTKTPPLAGPPPSAPRTQDPESGEFDTFIQLSSPPQTHSTQSLPASPTLESLTKQDGRSGLSAAVEMFERTQSYRENQRPRGEPQSMHRPLSQSSGSSQEVVEQHLTQEDVGSQPLLPSELQVETEPTDTELRWPTDDELDVLASEVIQNPGQPVFGPNHHLGSSVDSTRGQHFRCGSLDVSLGVNNYSASPPISSQPHTSQGSHNPSQPFVLQTQAPYSSQSTGWSQTE